MLVHGVIPMASRKSYRKGEAGQEYFDLMLHWVLQHTGLKANNYFPGSNNRLFVHISEHKNNFFC
jgi:hypothetical protein